MVAVSVVVPYFNRPALIKQTVASIGAQTFRDFEVVIVDDGSTPALQRPDLGEDAGYENMRIIRQDNRGSAAARNTGLRAATGEYVLFLDSDDLLQPQALEALWRTASSQDLDAVAGNWLNFSAEGPGEHFRPPFPYKDALANVVEAGWATACAIFKRNLNPFLSEEKSLVPWEIADSFARALRDQSARIGYVDQDIVWVRQDAASRLTILHNHFDPHKAGRFWQTLKVSVPLNDERRSAFDRQIFRYAFTLFHAANHGDARAMLSAVDAGRLTSYHWCRFLSPAWFVRWAGIRWGLSLHHLLSRAKATVFAGRSAAR